MNMIQENFLADINKNENKDSESNNLLYLSNLICNELDDYDFYSLMRYLESNKSVTDKSFADELNPKKQKIRISQDPHLAFPKCEIQDLVLRDGKLNIVIKSFGMLTINSPLPIHLVEHIFNRKHHYGDHSWSDFINMLQHRISILFYKAWAEAQNIHSLERINTSKFDDYILSMMGLSKKPKMEDELIDSYCKIFYSGFLIKHRSSYNLVKVLRQYFQIKVSIVENIGLWHEVDQQEQTSLGSMNYNLGDGLLLGSKIYDQNSKFRIILESLSFEEYQSFFKDKLNYKRMKEWVEYFVEQEYSWEIQPILKQESIPSLELSAKYQLGMTTWLGQVNNDADNLILQVS